MKKDPITFELKDGEYYWDGIILRKKDGEPVNGMVDFGYSHQWFKNGIIHREDGPARDEGNEQIWYWEGRRHRLNGPAIIRYGNSFEYWINGERYSEEKWKIISRKLKLEKLLK